MTITVGLTCQRLFLCMCCAEPELLQGTRVLSATDRPQQLASPHPSGSWAGFREGQESESEAALQTFMEKLYRE